LTRDSLKARLRLPGIEQSIQWSPTDTPDARASDFEAVINLAGENLLGRWNEEKKARIRDSRILGTRNLVRWLASSPQASRPGVLVNASAVGYYGDCGDREVDEAAPPGNDFLAEVCRAWESEAIEAEKLGLRVVCVRLGIVLGKGGALWQMLRPFKMGIGGKLGSGRQWMSWIHIKDAVRIIELALQDNTLSGPVNAVAPQPVTNGEFTRVLARVLRRPAFLPLPQFVLRALFGESADLLLHGQKVLPTKALRHGFEFCYPYLEAALRDILS